MSIWICRWKRAQLCNSIHRPQTLSSNTQSLRMILRRVSKKNQHQLTGAVSWFSLQAKRETDTTTFLVTWVEQDQPIMVFIAATMFNHCSKSWKSFRMKSKMLTLSTITCYQTRRNCESNPSKLSNTTSTCSPK